MNYFIALNEYHLSVILKLFSRKESSDILRRSQKFGQSSTCLVMSNKEWKMVFSDYLNFIIVTSVKDLFFSIFFIQKICVQKSLKHMIIHQCPNPVKMNVFSFVCQYCVQDKPVFLPLSSQDELKSGLEIGRRLCYLSKNSIVTGLSGLHDAAQKKCQMRKFRTEHCDFTKIFELKIVVRNSEK